MYYYDWKNKDNPKEWAMHKVRNPILCEFTPHLLKSYFPHFGFGFDCIYEGRYQFYIYHHLQDDIPKFDLTIMLGEKEIYSQEYPTKEMSDKWE